MKHQPNGKPRNHADEIANAIFMDMEEIERIEQHTANLLPTSDLPRFANLRTGGNIDEPAPLWAWFVGAAITCVLVMLVAYAYSGLWGV